MLKQHRSYPSQSFQFDIMHKILLIGLLVLAVHCQKYRKITHNTDPEARCLDGSPPALYVSQGAEADKVLIFLEGGGYCQGETQAQVIEECYQRSKTLLGSSNLWPQEIEGEGYLSNSPAESQFHNWTKFILAYCDGALHQGHRNEPIKYKNSSLYFRGNRIMKAQLTYLEQNFGLSKASKVVWSGGSAGAVAAVFWSGYFRQRFQTEGQKVYNIIDSGIFIDAPGHGTKNHHFATELKTLYKIANFEESTPLQVCNTFNPDNEWKCWLAQYNYQYLQGKFLFIDSQYDSWAIPNILKLKCLEKTSSGVGYTMKKCTQGELDSIEQYRQTYKLLLFQILQASERSSCWSIACSNHVFGCLRNTYQSAANRIPEYAGSSVRDLVEKFVIGEQDRLVSMDLQAWPSNHPCAI